MGFQSTVTLDQGFGVIGEIFDNGPVRAQPFIIVSDLEADNVFGRAFTVTAEGKAEAGKDGTQVFAGILINPKDQSSNGTTGGGALAPTLTIPNNTVAQLLSEGSIVVTLPASANIGDAVYFTDATGVIVTTAPGAAAPASSTLIKGAYVDRFTRTGAGLAVITLAPNSRAAA
jgi:hypothetical protein